MTYVFIVRDVFRIMYFIWIFYIFLFTLYYFIIRTLAHLKSSRLPLSIRRGRFQFYGVELN